VRTSAVVCGEISGREEFADMAVGVKAALNILFLDGGLVVCNGKNEIKYIGMVFLEWCFWSGVFRVVFLEWCFWNGVFGVVFLEWCF
jgi:hypothetical protein